MGKIEKIEDLNAWVEARKLVRAVYAICRQKELCREYALVDQIKRSSISIAANIAEGFGRYGLKDARNFYAMARGSLVETQSHLYVMRDNGFLRQNDFDEVSRQATVVSKLINGLISNSIRFSKEANI